MFKKVYHKIKKKKILFFMTGNEPDATWRVKYDDKRTRCCKRKSGTIRYRIMRDAEFGNTDRNAKNHVLSYRYKGRGNNIKKSGKEEIRFMHKNEKEPCF